MQPVRLKIDPGSKTTGLALVNDASGEVVWAAELTHRGQQVKKHLADRRAVRRSRRQRKTRYRPATLAESTPQAGLAAAFAGKPDCQRPDLGGTPAPAVPHWGADSWNW